ncbi:MAG: amino acid racemase [Pseudomonadota bacterium]
MRSTRTIGLLGGMSWESTIGYYQRINEGIKRELGGLHSAKLLLHSVDFAPIEAMQASGDWAAMGEMLAEAAVGLQQAGAQCLLIATNTMHKVAPAVEQALAIPLIHIADATGQYLVDTGHRTVGLLGTAFTMEQDFYRQRLAERFDLKVLIPEPSDRAVVHDVIYRELCLGHVKPDSRAHYVRIIEQLQQAGAESVILGCTEIGLLVCERDTTVPLVDTTAIHADAAVAFALENS